jgi:Ran GTPase-activating protein (RanGAP) involved in mRNA processing and transport
MIDDLSNSIIDFSHQKLVDRDLINIIQQIPDKQCLSLQLQDNAITSQGIMILIDSLFNHLSHLQDLWLSNNCISDLGIQILTRTYLSNNSTIKQLHLGSNCITDNGIQYLVEMLKINSTLTDLWLYNNQITDYGVQNLVNILKTGNRTLKHFDLQWNRSISDTSINALIDMLERNRILERMNLRKCSLSMAGKMQLLQAVVGRKDFKLII